MKIEINVTRCILINTVDVSSPVTLRDLDYIYAFVRKLELKHSSV